MAKIILELDVNAEKGIATLKQVAGEAAGATKQAGEGAKKAGEGFKEMSSSVEGTTAKLAALITPANLAGAAIGAALVASMKSAISSSVQFANEIHKLQLLTGSTATSVAALLDVTNDVGAEFNAVKMAMLRLSDQSEEAQAAFAQLNLTAKDGVGRFQQAAQAIMRIEDPMKRVDFVSQRFGARVAAELLPAFQHLAENTDAVTESMLQYEQVLGKEGVEALRQFGIAQGNVGDEVLKLQAVVAQDLVPVLRPMIELFSQFITLAQSIPSPLRAVVEMLALTAAGIIAVNAALKLFGLSTLAMTGPTGWIAAAVIGIGTLILSIDNLTGKLSRAWEQFKGRGMIAPPTATSPASPTGPSGMPGLVIIPKDIEDANAAIRKQIEAVKAQRIEFEQGSIAALKYTLAHGEMAKASPKLKAELLALTDTLSTLKTEQELQDQIQEMLNKDTNEATALIRANAQALKEQNDALALDALADALDELKAFNFRLSEELALENELIAVGEKLAPVMEHMFGDLRSMASAVKDLTDAQVKLGTLKPDEAIERQRGALLQLKTALQAQIALTDKDSLAQIKLQAELAQTDLGLKELAKSGGTVGAVMERAFDGITDILSLFGVKVGKIIIMLQQIPKALGGLEKIAGAIGGMVTLSNPATAFAGMNWQAADGPISNVMALGDAASTAGSELGFMGSVVGFVTRLLNIFGGGLNAFSGKIGNLLQQAGVAPGLAGTLGNATGGGAMGFGLLQLFGGGNMASQIKSTAYGAIGNMILPGIGGIIGSIIGVIDSKITGLITSIFGGNKGAEIGGQIGSFLGPVGTFIGSFIGSLFGSTPKGKMDVDILPFRRDAFRHDSQTEGIKGTRVGDVVVNFGGNVLSNKKEHKLQESLAKMLNELVHGIIDATVKLMGVLPERLGAELDAALSVLEETGLEIVDKKWKGGSAEKKLKKRVKGLADEAVGDLVEALGFGDIDLKALGGGKQGDAAKGFDAMISALSVMSTVITEAKVNMDGYTGTLADFTQSTLDYFKQFQQEGEAFVDTVKRVGESLMGIVALTQQIDATIQATTTDTAQAMQLLHDALQRVKDQAIAAIDALTVEVESGGSPEDVMKAAEAAVQAVTDALAAQIEAVTSLRDAVLKLNSAITDGVDLIIDLTQEIDALRGTELSASDFQFGVDGIVALFNQLEDVNSRIALFAAGIAGLAENLTLGAAQIPLVVQGFNVIMAQIHEMSNPTEAIAALKGLAGAVESGLQAAVAAVNRQTQDRIAALNEERAAILSSTAALHAQRDALQQKFDAEMKGLEAQRTAIQHSFDLQRSVLEAQKTALEAELAAKKEIFDEQKAALETALSLSREWGNVLQSVKAQLVDLFNLLAPTHPLTSLNEVRAQFNAAFADFQASPSTEAATRVQDLAKQMLQLAQQTPGFDLPSAAFQGLAGDVQTALEAIRDFAAAQPTEEAIQAQIVALEAQQVGSLDDINRQLQDLNDSESKALAGIDEQIGILQKSADEALAGIDNQIALLDANQAAALAAIDAQIAQANADGQEQIIYLQGLAADGLEAIRAQLVIEVAALAAQQAAADAALHEVLGDKSFEEIIADKQADAVLLLEGIDRTLQGYLGSIIASLGASAPAVSDQGATGSVEQTVSQTLKAAGYSKSQRQNMSLIDAQGVLGFDGSAWTDLLFPLGFKMETTLKDFFKQVYNTNQFDYTLSQIGVKLQEMISGIPALASGGYVPASPGGTLIRVGEGGQGEWVIPEGRSGGSKTEIVFAPQIIVHADSSTNGRRVAQELVPALLEAIKMGPVRKELQNAAKGR